MEGAVFTDYEFVQTLRQKTTTKTGLTPKVRKNDQYYPVGIKTRAQEVDSQHLQPHPVVPDLSYRLCA